MRKTNKRMWNEFYVFLKILKLLSEEDSLKKENTGFYKSKIEKLLIHGTSLHPSKKRKGESADTKGYRVIKEDILSGRSKPDFRIVYEKNGCKFIKLNLLIRFVN